LGTVLKIEHSLHSVLYNQGVDAWVDQSPDKDNFWYDEMAQKIMKSTIGALLISKNAEANDVVEKTFIATTRF
jgi:hypothetical protein